MTRRWAVWLVRTCLVACLAACGDDGGAPDASRDSETGDAGEGGRPRFEYVPVEGAKCANGTPLGLGVSPAPGADTLVVFVNGGGACWDAATCFGLNSAVHISTTYDATVMERDVAPLLGSELVRRGGDSPIADASFAFIPYCTGDLHSGRAVRSVATDLAGTLRDVHHVGRTNIELFANELAERFAVARIVLVGFSAGGYGAVLNADVFDDAFSATTEVLSDCSPFIQPTEYATWQRQWEMRLPDACSECETDFGAVVTHQAAGRRHGLIATTNDEVIRLFFGYGVEDIAPRTLRFVGEHYGEADTHAWVVRSTEHVLLGEYASRGRARGPTLRAWTDAFFDGGEAFATWLPD